VRDCISQRHAIYHRDDRIAHLVHRRAQRARALVGAGARLIGNDTDTTHGRKGAIERAVDSGCRRLEPQLSLAPQRAQNLLPCGAACPHWEQYTGWASPSGAPQPVHVGAPGEFATPQ
jgi:hypothetical protein